MFSALALAATPTLGTITPSSGSSTPDTAKTFTCIYSDASGWTHLKEVNLLINTSSTALTNSAYLYYDQNTNLLYLRNDANTAWLGGYAPGASNVIENSYAKLTCASTTVSGSGTTLTVNWSIIFKTPFTGTRKTYLYATDDVNISVGWTQKGTWTLPNSAPSVGTITPSSGAGQINVTYLFTTTYTDSNTYLNIQYVQFLINTAVSGANCFYGYYNRDSNKFYLRNDANSAWLGGYAPGASNIIENSYAKLSCSQSTASGSGNILTVKWAITFKSTFTGSKNMYLYMIDYAGAANGWTQKGTWLIDATAPTGTIKINNNAPYTNSTIVTLNLSAADTGSGMGTGAQMQFSNDKTTWSTSEAYATTKSWTLTSGDGTKTVYVKFKDVAGNWSTPVSDTIILDTTKPAITITTPQDGTIITDP